MKKTISLFAIITLVLGFAVTTIGQNSTANGVVTANANVVGTLAVTQHLSLEFGDLLDSGPKTIALDNSASGSGSLNTGTMRAGIFKISKGLNTTVTLTFPSIITALTGTVGGNTLAIGSYNAIWNTDPALFTGTSVATGGGSTSPCGSLTEKDFYVHLAATVTPTSTTLVDTYTGSITLTATYN